MLEALTAAVRERDKADAWGIPEAQRATTQELLYAIYRVLCVAHLKPPHPAPDWEAWRPDEVKALRAAQKNRPLSGRQFLTRLLGR